MKYFIAGITGLAVTAAAAAAIAYDIAKHWSEAVFEWED